MGPDEPRASPGEPGDLHRLPRSSGQGRDRLGRTGKFQRPLVRRTRSAGRYPVAVPSPLLRRRSSQQITQRRVRGRSDPLDPMPQRISDLSALRTAPVHRPAQIQAQHRQFTESVNLLPTNLSDSQLH